jgi:hypothetical protein
MKRLIALFLLAAQSVFAANFLDADRIDLKALLPAPPAPDSPVTRAELDVVLQLQAGRTPAQAARCQLIESEDVFLFGSEVFGSWFNAANLPQTAAFFLRKCALTSCLSIAQPRPSGPAAARRMWMRISCRALRFPTMAPTPAGTASSRHSGPHCSANFTRRRPPAFSSAPRKRDGSNSSPACIIPAISRPARSLVRPSPVSC